MHRLLHHRSAEEGGEVGMSFTLNAPFAGGLGSLTLETCTR